MNFDDAALKTILKNSRSTEKYISIRKEEWAKIELALTMYNQVFNDDAGIPNLQNATATFLADELGDIRQKSKALDKFEKLIKTVLTTKKDAGAPAVQGERWNQEFQDGSQTRLDLEAVRAEMGEEWCSNHSKTITFITIRSSRIK